ncbi:DUF1963 domain-containing protein [Nocardiopsis dassonvillei]|uniref:DUF1963 domain-containing protein n=1 Tax=Nocardiopsis dassonvillei TaxID=2014 RepID=UPI003F4CE4E0
MDSFEEYRDAARRSGVPEHAVDTGLRLARPQIGLGPADGGGGVLAGRYGGRPVLPPDVDWNGFPDLIASVDCAALPRDVLDFPLPQDGHLLFFANRCDLEGSAGDGAVVHVPSGAAAVERVPDEGTPTPIRTPSTPGLPGACRRVPTAPSSRTGRPSGSTGSTGWTSTTAWSTCAGPT